MRGTDRRATIDRLHITKAPFTFAAGLKIREMSNPPEKEKINRKDPAVNYIPVSEYPAHRSPYGPNMANDAKPHPATKTNNARALVENLRMNKA